MPAPTGLTKIARRFYVFIFAAIFLNHSVGLSVVTTTTAAPAVHCDKILRKYPFLTQGSRSSLRPELVFSEAPIRNIVRDYTGPDAVIIACPYHARLLEGTPGVLGVATNSPEEVQRTLAHPLLTQAERVIGIGGSAANDVAKAVAVGKRELIGITPILSTNCISTNRSVVGDGLDAISFRASTPVRTIVPILSILEQPEATRTLWTSSGLGDYFAAISAAIDTQYERNAMATEAIRANQPKPFEALDWVNHSFVAYDRPTLEIIARLLHDSSLLDIETDSNLGRIGGEHAFYRLVVHQNPSLRHRGATHGQIVAVGTLINAKILSKKTANDEIYEELRSAFSKLKLPMTYRELENLHLTKAAMMQALTHLSDGATRRSLMADYFEQGDGSILDEVFGSGCRN